MSPWREIRQHDIRRFTVGYLFLASLIVFTGWATWHNRQLLAAQVHRQRSSEMQRDLEMRLAWFRLCRSDGRSVSDCRKISASVILPALTRNQEKEIVKILGQPGKAGALGQEGIRGLVGRAGVRGLHGPRGAQGPQGAPGLRGPAGKTGAAGNQGPPGSAGRTGSTGPPGAQGPVGPRGPIGQRGPTGPRGPTGAGGVVCPTGYSWQLRILRLWPTGSVSAWICAK